MNKKRELIDDLRKAFADWEALLAGVSESEIIARPGNDKWSISEVITHLCAWQEVSIAHLEAALLNTAPQFPAWLGSADPFYAEDHVDTFNARIQKLHRSQSWSTRHREWREGFLRFLELSEAIPDSIMFDKQRQPWLRGYSLAAVLEGSCQHHQHHLSTI